jgi:hypothetical protein
MPVNRIISMAYEEGMAIFYDVVDRTILVNFRQELTMLPGPFLNRQEGMIAGQALCRAMGWRDIPLLA